MPDSPRASRPWRGCRPVRVSRTAGGRFAARDTHVARLVQAGPQALGPPLAHACLIFQGDRHLSGRPTDATSDGGDGRPMARDYDSQLLESVGVRRRRMRDALLFGAQRARRTADERLGKVFAGIALAAVMCAGCVGWSFLQHTLDKQKAEQEKQQRQAQQYDRTG